VVELTVFSDYSSCCRVYFVPAWLGQANNSDKP
jgi:hypothetical protein